MKLTTFTVLCLIILALAGCSGGIPGISKYIQASLTADGLHPSKTAVIVQLFGMVLESWANATEKALKDPEHDLVILWID